MSSPPANSLSPDAPPGRSYTIWPSLILGAILAVLVPSQWINYSDRLRPFLFNFHFVVLILYVPLAFGLFWPMFVALHAVYVPALRTARPRRVKAAEVVCTICMLLSAPCVFFEWRSLKALQDARDAQAAHAKQVADQQQADRLQAAREILSAGVLAFHEPLTPAQTWALDDYLLLHPLPPPDCLQAAQQYHTSLVVLTRLAGNKTCSSDALQALYETALVIQSQQAPTAYPNVYSLFMAIAANPNTPPDLLGKLLQHHLYGVRLDAARNPSTPKPEKIAYLRTCLSREYADREYAATDRDTPPDILEKLASEPNFINALANNPNTPVPLLQHIADTTDNTMIRSAARQNLASRHPN